MKEATKTNLVDAIEAACDCGYGEVSFRPDYSGRGRYGRDCVGITGSRGDCMKLIAYVISEMASEMASEMVDAIQSEEDSDTNPQAEFDECVETLLNFGQDSMGRGVIVYWSRLTKVQEAEECEDEQEAA